MDPHTDEPGSEDLPPPPSSPILHRPVLEALRDEPLDRRDIEEHLDVSRATSYRFTQWLDEQGFV